MIATSQQEIDMNGNLMNKFNGKLLNCPLASTGEAPAEIFGREWGGRDDYSMRDWTLIAGYLDAPDLIPAGSAVNCNYDEVPVSRYIAR